MKYLYKNIILFWGLVIAMTACSVDPLQESKPIIPENTDPEEVRPPNPHWAWVSSYPGALDMSLPRLTDVAVKVDASYALINIGYQYTPYNLQSTGLYVPPAEAVTINLMGGATNVKYQVGIASWDLGKKPTEKRYNDVSTSGTLTAGENTIISDFGGNLYFYFDGATTSGDVSLTVSGATATIDFRYTSAKKDDLPAWRSLIMDTINPLPLWGELIGDNLILTLPMATLQKIERPDIIIHFYESYLKDNLNSFFGYTMDAKTAPLRLYSDVELLNAADGSESKVYPYYPFSFNSATTDSLTDALIGVAMLEEVTAAKKQLILSVFNMAYSASVNLSPYMSKDVALLGSNYDDLVIGKFDMPKLKVGVAQKEREKFATAEERNSMYLVLFQKYGWNLMTDAIEKMRNLPEKTVGGGGNDLFAMYASDYAGADLTEFFNAYDFPNTSISKEYMKKYYGTNPLDPSVWESLSDDLPVIGGEFNPAGIDYEKNTPSVDTIYDRSEWIFDKEKSVSNWSNEGAAGGDVKSIFDGLDNTFWHSSWGEGSPGLFSKGPQWFWVKFRESLAFNYFYSSPRYNSATANARRFTLHYATTPEEAEADHTTWMGYVNTVDKKFNGTTTDPSEIIKASYFYWEHELSANDNLPKAYFYTDEMLNAHAVKITYYDANGGADGYAMIGEFALGLVK